MITYRCHFQDSEVTKMPFTDFGMKEVIFEGEHSVS